MTIVTQADTDEQLAAARELLLEYAESLNFSLCFQGFDRELASLPGAYAPPDGPLLLCECDSAPAGCVALKRVATGVCEMKRLYVRPAYRGRQLGRLLASRAIQEARSAGYTSMRLDTIEGAMHHAIALYRALGFREIAPYYDNPVPGALYFELTL